MNAKRMLFGAGSIALIAATHLMLFRNPIAFAPETGTGSGGGDGKTPEQLAADLKKSFDDSVGKAKEIAEKALAEAEKTGDVAAKTKETADEALKKMNELNLQLTAVEQQMVQLGKGAQGAEAKSIGERFVESEQVKKFLESTDKKGRASMDFKEAVTVTTVPGSAGALIQPERLPGIIAPPDRRLTVRDLLSPGTMGSNAIEYIRETGFTNNAGMVEENTKKPQSDIKFDAVVTTPKVIAHFMKASRQVMDDAPQLASYINGRLLYGLAYKEETQLLNGDGTGQNLFGIIPQATPYAAPAGVPAALTRLDVIRIAMLQAVMAEYPATGHVLNPIDWAIIELSKDDQKRYLIGNPQGTTIRTLWGLPVVETQAIAAGNFLTGAFKLGAQIFDRHLARVEIATENEDDFVNNRITVLAEERLALAVYRPECFIKGALPAA